MNEAALRALVREAVERHLGGGAPGRPVEPRPATPVAHASHGRYLLQAADGSCLIEPAVQCNHCGYCQSHGH